MERKNRTRHIGSHHYALLSPPLRSSRVLVISSSATVRAIQQTRARARIRIVASMDGLRLPVVPAIRVDRQPAAPRRRLHGARCRPTRLIRRRRAAAGADGRREGRRQEALPRRPEPHEGRRRRRDRPEGGRGHRRPEAAVARATEPGERGAGPRRARPPARRAPVRPPRRGRGEQAATRVRARRVRRPPRRPRRRAGARPGRHLRVRDVVPPRAAAQAVLRRRQLSRGRRRREDLSVHGDRWPGEQEGSAARVSVHGHWGENAEQEAEVSRRHRRRPAGERRRRRSAERLAAVVIRISSYTEDAEGYQFFFRI